MEGKKNRQTSAKVINRNLSGKGDGNKRAKSSKPLILWMGELTSSLGNGMARELVRNASS